MDRYGSAYSKLEEIEKKKNKVDLDDFEEFMRKVEEVNKMVHALASGDKVQVEEASKSADAWLANQKNEKSTEKEIVEELINDPSQPKNPKKTRVSVINPRVNKKNDEEPKPSENLDNLNCETMSQEAFMKSVEDDARKRREDRRQRISESDAIKLKANEAFRENNFVKALDLYNKAIDVRKDSCVLYTNRALTLLNLELYTRALKDAETALRLNENSFKARLYKWHALNEMGMDEEAKECMSELKSTFLDRTKEIESYEKRILEDGEVVDG